MKNIMSESSNCIIKDNYLHVDDDVPCFAEDDYLEDTSLGQSRARDRVKKTAASARKKMILTRCRCMVSHSEARHSAQLLQRYFVEQGFSEEHHTALDMCAGEVFH